MSPITMFNESPVSEDPQNQGDSQHQSTMGPHQTMQSPFSIPVLSLNWFEEHVLDSILHPTTRLLITLMWKAEAFDHFNEGEFELLEHLHLAQPGLLREWNRRSREAEECVEASKTNSRKRGPEETPGPVAKRENNSLPVMRESREATIENIPPFRRYDAIYLIEEAKADQVDYYPDPPCHLLFSFGDGDTMRGAFHLGDFDALLFFAKRPRGPSNDRVPFIWRGRDRGWKKTYSGYTNKGWIQFLEDGTFRGRFDKFHLKFGGRREGEYWSRSYDNSAKRFWLEWNNSYSPEEEIETGDDSSDSEDCDME